MADTETKFDPGALAEAVNALGAMSRLFQVFQNAQAVLAVLTNADQVGRELDAAIARKREELEQALRDVTAARETAQTLDAQAKSLLAEATASAELMAAEAKRAAKASADELAARQAEGDKLLADQAAMIAEGQKSIDTMRAELVEIETKLQAAEAARRAVLEG